jgi:hypothetical protein
VTPFAGNLLAGNISYQEGCGKAKDGAVVRKGFNVSEPGAVLSGGGGGGDD